MAERREGPGSGRQKTGQELTTAEGSNGRKGRWREEKGSSRGILLRIDCPCS